MKLLAVCLVTLIAVSLSDSCSSPAPDIPAGCFDPSLGAYPTQLPACYNPKLALYQKFPLLYKVHAKNCKHFCDKVRGVNPCPPAAPPKFAPAPCALPHHVAVAPPVLVASPAPCALPHHIAVAPPAPCALPPPVAVAPPAPVAPPTPLEQQSCPTCSACSACSASAGPAYPPELLKTLFALSNHAFPAQGPSCPCGS